MSEHTERDKSTTRRILEAAWDRLEHAEDPIQPGFYAVNFISVVVWEALRQAMFEGFDE